MDVELKGKLSGYNQGLVDSCEVVKKAISGDYTADRAKLGQYLKAQMTGSVYNIGRQEFIKPLAETIVSGAASNKKVGEQIQKAADYVKEKFTSSSTLINNKGVSPQQPNERAPIALETTIRKSGVGTESEGTKHKVKAGETVWGIAQEHGMSEFELMQANPKLKMHQDKNGVNIVKIHPGDKIFIPAKYTASVSSHSKTNQVPNDDHGVCSIVNAEVDITTTTTEIDGTIGSYLEKKQDVVSKYVEDKLLEYLKEGKMPNVLDIAKSAVGLEVELLGSVVADLKQEYPTGAKILDDIINYSAPRDRVLEQA